MTTPLGPGVTVQPIVIRQGATFRARYTWTEGGEPQSLEGFEARLAISRRAGGKALVEIHSTAGEIVLEPNDEHGNKLLGTMDFFIPPAKTRLLTRSGYYDLVLIDDSDPTEVIRLLEGVVTLDPGITPTGVPEV